MYGSEIGSLRVLVRNNVSSTSLTSEACLWSISGQMGDQWNSGQANISSIYTNQPFQIILEGTVGGGYHGDIAVDDVNVQSGSCATTPFQAYCGQSTLDDLMCTFDSGSVCGDAFPFFLFF